MKGKGKYEEGLKAELNYTSTADPLVPTAMAFVSYGFVLVRVRVRLITALRMAVICLNLQS
jgi:hypothetical protein